MTANSIIRDLNDILKIQLTAINQFFVHSKIQKKNGWPTIAMRYARFGIQGGKTADKLLELLVDLNELPQIKDYDLLKSHRDIQKQLALDTTLLLAMVSNLHKCIKKCKEHAEKEIEAILK
jgi:bacterioferritin